MSNVFHTLPQFRAPASSNVRKERRLWSQRRKQRAGQTAPLFALFASHIDSFHSQSSTFSRHLSERINNVFLIKNAKYFQEKKIYHSEIWIVMLLTLALFACSVCDPFRLCVRPHRLPPSFDTSQCRRERRAERTRCPSAFWKIQKKSQRITCVHSCQRPETGSRIGMKYSEKITYSKARRDRSIWAHSRIWAADRAKRFEKGCTILKLRWFSIKFRLQCM